MQLLYIDPDTGNASQIGEEDLTQEILQNVDHSAADVFRFNEETKHFERCAVTLTGRGDDNSQYQPVWSPI